MSSTPKPTKNAAPQPHEPTEAARSHRHAFHEAGGAAGGAIAGAALGAVAGPAGAAAGALIGGAVGAVVAKVVDDEAERVSLHDAELDEVIGVTGGDIGAPNLKHPPAKRGTYSGASAGGGGGGEGSTADGPMQAPDD